MISHSIVVDVFRLSGNAHQSLQCFHTTTSQGRCLIGFMVFDGTRGPQDNLVWRRLDHFLLNNLPLYFWAASAVIVASSGSDLMLKTMLWWKSRGFAWFLLLFQCWFVDKKHVLVSLQLLLLSTGVHSLHHVKLAGLGHLLCHHLRLLLLIGAPWLLRVLLTYLLLTICCLILRCCFSTFLANHYLFNGQIWYRLDNRNQFRCATLIFKLPT